MVGWPHRLNGHEFEQALGDGEGQGSLARCSPWGRKESDATERLNNKRSDHLNLNLWLWGLSTGFCVLFFFLSSLGNCSVILNRDESHWLTEMVEITY